MRNPPASLWQEILHC